MPVPLIVALVVLYQLGLLTTGRGAENQNPRAPTEGQGDGNPPPLVIFQALCDALRTNYPMLELAGWRDEEWPAEFARRIGAAGSREEAFELMDELVCRLNDYHTRLSWPNRPALVGPPFRVEPVSARKGPGAERGIWGRVHPPITMPALEGVAIAVTATAEGSALAPGDEIVSVDNVPVQKALAEAWPHVVCSSVAGKLRSAANRMLQGAAGSEVKLGVRRAEHVQVISIARARMPSEPRISSREVDGVPVIRITAWSNEGGSNLRERFDELLAQFRQRPCLVIDVRGNGGGDDDLAGEVVARFLKEPIIASISFERLVPAQTFERRVDWVEPRGPWRYEGRVAVLVDEGCMSACEHFVSGMTEAGALLCGTPSSGACGWIRSVALPGGARVNVSRTLPLHTGGIPSPELGIAPHIWAPRTLTDLRAGKDTALVAALAWLKSNDPLPVRFQPLASGN